MIAPVVFVAGLLAVSANALPVGDVNAPFAQEIPTSFVPGNGIELNQAENALAVRCLEDGGVTALFAAPEEGAPCLPARWVDGVFVPDPSSGDAPVAPDTGEALSIAHGPGGATAKGLASGLLISAKEGAPFVQAYPSDEQYSWAPRNVTVLTYDRQGRLWFGCDLGVGAWDGANWALYTGAEGLPYTHFTCAAPGEDGVVWFGTERGAIRFDGKRWDYRASLRWLPDDYVNGIAVEPNGTAWIATRKGIARIERRQMSLAEKAANFERIIAERHWRLDYVVRCYFEAPGALDTAYMRHTDNDGLYTALYGASQCFRYGATKDPEAKERAKRCFRGLKFLYDATGIPGFPARSVWPVVEGGEDPNEHFGAAANAAMQEKDPLWKSILPRWPKTSDGKFYWKCDTSSDEICGHYFFFGAYYDLVAETAEEKAEVTEVVRALTDHIVDHGFQLVDHDGLPTRWGRWSPDYINTLQGWADRGIQSVEMLSFLNVARHVTGDEKYGETARMLREKHAYHINALWGKAVWPPACVVPWDGNLAFTSLYGLVKYETDPEVLKYYRLALDNTWLFVSRQNDPFFNYVYAALMPDPDEPVYDDVVPDMVMPREGALETLRDTPLLLIGWDMENAHRLDVDLKVETRWRPNYGWQHNGRAIPVQERSHIRINSDHFDLNGGGGGMSEYEGSFYLLPYYLGLYHGLLK